MASYDTAKSFSEVVIADWQELNKLPKIVQQAYRSHKEKKILPWVIFADPKGQKIYGTCKKSEITSDGGKRAFREVKKLARSDMKAGIFGKASEKPKVTDLSEEEEVELSSNISIESSKIETWESVKGSQIQAKLLSVTNEVSFQFLTEEGKEIIILAHQLSPESLKRARDLSGLNK